MQGLKVFGSRFFWKLYVSYIAVLMVTAAIVVVLIDRRLTEASIRSLETALDDKCALLEPYLRPVLRDPAAAAPRTTTELTEIARQTGLRITLILPNGRVVVDSHEVPARMDSHAQRPEVRGALATGRGASNRMSHTVGYPMLYVAHLVRDVEAGTPLGIVRTAMSLADIEQEQSAALGSVYTGTAIGLVVALCLGLLVARRITAPIAAITRAAEDLREGKYERRVPVVSEGELGVLADTMNRLGLEITMRIARITREDARLRAMLAGMVEGVIAVDENDRISFCNDAARRLLDIHAVDVVGRSVWDAVRVSGIAELLEQAREAKTVRRGEIVLRHAATDRILDAHASPFLSGEGGETGPGAGTGGLVIVLHDVTDLRRLERVRRDFVANVSHELKTPLTSIKGFVETLLGGALREDEVNERFLLRIDDNVDRLSHLVSDLLSLARIESQSGVVPREPVECGPIVSRVLRANGEVARSKGLQLIAEPAEPLVVLGDSEAIEQVVGNLIVNAIHYTHAGEVRVRMLRKGYVGVIEVQDTGEGIPPEDLDRVFERFYRVEKGRSKRGTGLGLSIVRNLVHGMKGTVRVESELGAGSLFTVELELASPESPPEPSAPPRRRDGAAARNQG